MSPDRRSADRDGVERRSEGGETIQAILVEEWGEPAVLEPKRIARPEPGEGEVRVRVRYAGVNYVDVYHRSGMYPKEPPFVPGLEAAGIVDALGPDADGVQVGDRVAFAMSPGAYAEEVVVPDWKLVRVPERVGLDTAAAVMLQGMTAHYLSAATFRIAEGDRVLVHAVAGGVGLLLTQLAKKRGATVLGTCSTEEKAERARAAGADHVILYTEQDFHAETMSYTGGAGVDVVYDSVGRDTFERSLKCLRPRGMLVLFGQSSGPVPPIDPQRLARQGSVYLTRPSLGDYASDGQAVRAHATPLFSWIQGDQLDVRVDQVVPLEEAQRAHSLLESRRTSGKLLLRVGE